jgi:hypothetical protein
VKDGRLVATGKADLTTKKQYMEETDLIFDWKTPADGATEVTGSFHPPLGFRASLPKGAKPGSWNRVIVKGSKTPMPGQFFGPVSFRPTPGLEIMNVFVNWKKEK